MGLPFDYFKKIYSDSRFALTSFVFRIFLGFVYLVLFITHIPQILPLIGSKGLIPAAESAGAAASYFTYPTLHLFLNSDFAIIAIMIAGIVFSLLLILGFFPRISLIACFVLFLSIVVSGSEFFFFQWDSLLLEATFLSFFLPLGGKLIGLKKLREPHRILVFLFSWLLFKLYFESGLIKVLAGRSDWLKLEALKYYYETAPLPSLGGYLVQQIMPGWFHSISTLLSLIVELALPFMFFLPRKFRIISFYIFLGFNMVIMTTSNYGYFNLLAMTLSIFLLDDKHIEFLHSKARKKIKFESNTYAPRIMTYFLYFLAGFIIIFSIIEFVQVTNTLNKIEPVNFVQSAYHPFRIVNRYHLFPSIVQERNIPEILAQENGKWIPIRFRNTNQEIGRMPPQLLLYQDRFAFQYSFVMLGQLNSKYFYNTVRKICKSPEELEFFIENRELLNHKFERVRVDVYRYKFSSTSQLINQGVWWERQLVSGTNIIECNSV